MSRLPSIQCPECNSKLEDVAPEAKSKSAVDYSTCRRRCEKCGLGFSNAQTDNIKKLTTIYRNCFTGIPAEIAEGYERVLAQAFNEKARTSKAKRFTFSTSEDHATWSVFRYLQCEHLIRVAVSRAGIQFVAQAESEPTILLWGSPVPADNPNGRLIMERLIAASDRLEEDRDKRSEPDVILDFGPAGIVFIEVKLGSPNAIAKGDYDNWSRYLGGSTKAFRSESEIRRTGLYELARNWRIAWEMADGAPIAVVNLGPATLFRGKCGDAIATFANALNQDEQHRFVAVSWEKFLGDVNAMPGWFQKYLFGRRVVYPFCQEFSPSRD